MIFAQGDSADAIFHIHRGAVGLKVVSKSGKEATISILKEGDFFGESCLTGEPLRECSATALSDCRVMRIEKNVMREALHRQTDVVDMFVSYLVTRNLRHQADLVNHILNSSEKRLARILLQLARFVEEGDFATVTPKLSQETLASMVGTTRSRVGFFLTRFEALGFVRYDARNRLQVHKSMINLILQD